MATSSPLRVGRDSLQEADRQLALLADVMLDEEDDVRPWVLAARRAVQAQLEEADHE